MDKSTFRSANNLGMLILWLIASAIGVVLAMNMDSAAIVDGKYIPVGNDALYHGRRILDAALGERGFYQFDTMIHVPQGSWITWPWAYDYLMAMALVAASNIDRTLEPMAFLARVPVTWVFVNSGLMIMICRRMKLGIGFTAIALLAFSLSPLVQALHGLGRIDHHFVELSFMLATVWLGIGYFEKNPSTRNVYAYGLVLAIAPAFHNGLFILQLPGLFIAFIFWLQQRTIDVRKARTFAIVLFLGTLVILLPSAPFLDLQFEFSTLSWFHLYIAGCTAVCSLYLASTATHSAKRKLATLPLLVSVLVLPLIVQFLNGIAFISGEALVLDQIIEVKGPLRMYLDAGSSLEVTRYYSWLIILSPVLLAVYGFRVLQVRDARQIGFAIYVIFGILLLLAQFRLHPFGFWALFIGPLVIMDEFVNKYSLNRMAVVAGCLAALALAFQPPLRHQLFGIFPPGITQDYAAARSMFPVLQSACLEQPGIALANSNDGHAIRYHTSCSVIANNFLLTKQHTEKFRVTGVLINMTPEELVATAPSVKYVFARFYGIFSDGPNGKVPTPIDELKADNALLFSELLLRPEPPENYELLGELRVEDDRDIPFVRVFRIVR